MKPETRLTAASLRAPRAAAIAGILFSILLAFPLWVLLVSLHILVGNLRGPSEVSAPALEE